MQYAIRAITNVVLKHPVTKEPVHYFETLKTSNIEFSGSTVFARGGFGDPKLIGFDSEREITIKFEDSLISKSSLAVITGSKFKKTSKPIHKKEVLIVEEDGTDKIIKLSQKPTALKSYNTFFYVTDNGSTIGEKLAATIATTGVTPKVKLTGSSLEIGDMVIADYYIDPSENGESLTVTSETFPGTYTLEADTFWRNENGDDIVAKYTIPKIKIKPNFTLTHGASGDPSVFGFEGDVLADKKSGNSMVIIELLEE
ncbi:hypothetical protein ACEU2D_18380 [Brevibacillus laterosporus]|uniref:hypothetical protein n=1 Tax=Brevibacillus laterosporus TaxID=1465 RepID=UPI0035A60037